MRTQTESDRVHELTCELLKRRGINPDQANYDQYADAASIAAEAVEEGRTTVAEMLAVGGIANDTAADEKTMRTLARFATNGKFVADLSLTEQELLEAAIAAEERDTVAASTLPLCAHGYDGGKVDGCPYCA